MTCLFCGNLNLEEEGSPQNKINIQLAEYLCKILGIPSDGSYYHTTFCEFNYCNVCESRIYKSQTLLQKLEVIQKEIEETKIEFEAALKETYLSRQSKERNQNDNETDQVEVQEDDSSLIEFRHSLVSQLHLIAPLKPEIDHRYSTSRSFHGNYCKLEGAREEIDHDYGHDYYQEEGDHWDEGVDHEIVQDEEQENKEVLRVMSKKNSKRKINTSSHRKNSSLPSKIKFGTSISNSDIKLKDLRVRLERLSPEEISGSSRKSSSFNLRGRIKCSHRNCFRYFPNQVTLQKHIKFHHSGKRGNKIPKTEADSSEVEVISDSEDKNGDANYELEKHPSRPFRCTVKRCRSSFRFEAMRDAHVKAAHEEAAVKSLRYVCTEKDCTETYREFRALQAHIKKVHLGYENPHECELCEPEKVGFKTRTLLWNHKKSVHPDRPKVFACKSCFKEFQVLGDLFDHIATDHPEIKKKRKVKSTSNLSNSSKHNIKSLDVTSTPSSTTDIISTTVLIPGDSIQVGGEEVAVANFDESTCENTVSLQPKYPCTIEGCTSLFTSTAIRRRHVLHVHEGKSLKTLQCSEQGCGSRFRDKTSLQVHVNKVHLGSETPYECYKCDFKCSTRNELRAHRIEYPDHEEKRGRKSRTFAVEEQNFICHHCGNVYHTKESFRHHLRVHGPRKHTCPYTDCTKAFIKRGDLKNHLITHTKEKTVICFQCGKGLRDKQGLNHHLTICQLKDMKSELKCEKCNRSYKYQSTYEAHLKEHEGVADHPFKCDFPECNYSCKFNSMLVLHKQRHALTKDFECEHCTSKFKYKQHLIRHRDLKHFGTRGYRCHLCDYVGNSKTSLQTHLYSHTGEKPFECHVCQKNFTSQAHLTRHTRLHAAGKMIINKKTKQGGDGDNNNKLNKKVYGDEAGSKRAKFGKRMMVEKDTGSHGMEGFVYMDAEGGEGQEGEEEDEQMQQQNVVQVQVQQQIHSNDGETVLAFVASEVELI